MGDRANVAIKDSDGGTVYLYTHWDGSELPGVVQTVLRRLNDRVLRRLNDRWTDAPYLARIIFSRMVGAANWSETTGYGISSGIVDNDGYPLILLESVEQEKDCRVIAIDLDYVQGEGWIERQTMDSVSFSFAEFCEIEAEDLWTVLRWGMPQQQAEKMLKSAGGSFAQARKAAEILKGDESEPGQNYWQEVLDELSTLEKASIVSDIGVQAAIDGLLTRHKGDLTAAIGDAVHNRAECRQEGEYKRPGGENYWGKVVEALQLKLLDNSPHTQTLSLNTTQLAITRDYQNGQFSHITNLAQAENCGDSLLHFMLLQAEDEPGYQELFQRYRSAAEDLFSFCGDKTQ